MVRNAVSEANSPTAQGRARIGINVGTDVATENKVFSFATLKIMASDTGLRKGTKTLANASFKSGWRSRISHATFSGFARRYVKEPGWCGTPSSTMRRT